MLLSPIQASVPRYCFADDTFWFIVVVEMEDGRWWELQRLYQDFYDLQINLITEFPREAGNVKGVERSLPYMPGPVTYVTDNISNGRRANLDEYIRSLLKLGAHIVKGFRVRKFFSPREGDYEIDPTVSDPYRISTGSMDPGNTITPQSSGTFSAGYGSTAINPSARTSQTLTPSNFPSYQQGGGHQRNLSTGTAAHVPGPGGAGGAMKIKVWFGPDNCVVIRMPQNFRYGDLIKKLGERRALEPGFEGERDVELDVLYREEGDGKLYRLQGDEDLLGVVERNAKLTLEVRALR
jgi:bud emergence protein 1